MSIPGWDGASQVAVVLLAFSALIFVHELGHFLAAKLVGVRVERFFIGFDAWGMALTRTWRGCVYGIGILPLGGYVKLAGQADDPREEKREGKADELTSKSLPAQALVFAAGVLMNFLFAFILLVAGYLYGIPFLPNVLGRLDPDGQAATYGLKSGDRVLSINGKTMHTFEDIQERIFEQAAREMTVRVRRDEGLPTEAEQDLRIRAVPNTRARGRIHSIGAAPPESRKVAPSDAPEFRRLRDRLRPGDEILALRLGDAWREIGPHEGWMLQDLVRDRPGETIRFRVRRADGGAVEETDVPLLADGTYDIGLRFFLKVGAVTERSSAAEAGLRAGDRIEAIEKDGVEVRFNDVDAFRALVREHALHEVEIGLVRDGAPVTVRLRPAPRPGDRRFGAGGDTFLGVAVEPDAKAGGFRVTEALADGSTLRSGDLLTTLGDAAGRTPAAKLDPARPLGEQVDRASALPVRMLVRRGTDAPLRLTMTPRMHPLFGKPMVGIEYGLDPGVSEVVPDSFADRHWRARLGPGARVAYLLPGDTLRTSSIGFVGPGDRIEEVLFATPAEILAAPRAAGLTGRLPFALTQLRESRPAASLGEACLAAGERWVDMTKLIYKVIYRLVTREVSVETLGGPALLLRSIQGANEVGFWYLIYLVAAISVNLGICNLLPLPVLDGGHLVFLLYHAVTGSPPHEKFREFAQWAGILLLLALLLTVTWFDLKYW